MDSHLCRYFSPPRLGCHVLGIKNPTEEQAFDRIAAYTVERGRGHRVDMCAPGANPQDRRFFRVTSNPATLTEGLHFNDLFRIQRMQLGCQARQQRAKSGHQLPANKTTFQSRLRATECL
ncbi:hypothetical protein [Brevundimonas diminuta]|uniref:hypothetical protein n=1 Tax=Brevundimonas diminuta TaxID=293 RepID=UPI0012FCBA32|nr:hypothetical protein [Brevundimonas diminuta]